MKKFNNKIVTFAVLLILITCAALSSLAVNFISSDDISVLYKNKTFLIGGDSVGIKLLSEGVLVMKIDRENIDLKIGDVILTANGIKVNTSASLEDVVKNSEGKNIDLEIKRENINKKVSIKPVFDSLSKEYKINVWVKDSTAGVGTITFYDKDELTFAGLGHGVTETDENFIVPIETGAITSTDIYSIKKGYANDPRRSKRDCN